MNGSTLSLRDVLGRPELLLALTPEQWDLVLRQARASGLTARLSYLIEHGWREAVPAEVCRHFDAARMVADKLARDVERELHHVVEPLLLAGLPVIALKGAAYIAGNLAAAQGRVFDDIDILVPRDSLDLAERRLIGAGWRGEEKGEWDQRFYRHWMHQLPPMVHASRYSVIDLHFSIVPNRARRTVPSEPLFRAARPAPRFPAVGILAPCDMVLHGAAHLFNDSEFYRGLRNLVDLDLLLRQFASTQEFWSGLLERATSLGLGRPLCYALHYTNRFMATPVPPTTLEAVRRFAPPMPALMDALFERALRPSHSSARDRLSGCSDLLLFARGNWLRLPLYLLAPHLLRSFYMRCIMHLPARESAE